MLAAQKLAKTHHKLGVALGLSLKLGLAVGLEPAGGGGEETTSDKGGHGG